MNKQDQLIELHRRLVSPGLESGIYLIDTDLSDEDIGVSFQYSEDFSYHRGSLIPSENCRGFEWFVIKLSLEFESGEIVDLRNSFLRGPANKRDAVLLSLLVLVMRKLGEERKAIIHICGNYDIISLSHDELSQLKESIIESKNPVIIINKKRLINPIIKTISLKDTHIIDYKMERTEVLHISYKHDDAYEDALKAIQAGLEKKGIQYSIDEYDIMYRDSIDDYEKEIGASDWVIMFVIPSYLKSLDCMFEMTQMFKNGKVRDRVFPVVDMGGIPRNGDGLTQIKGYWQGEKVRKSEQIKAEPGGSSFLLMEIQRIDDIIKILDDFWIFICRDSTGKYETLIENEASLLIEEISKCLNKTTAIIDKNFVPTKDTKPFESRHIIQNGEKSVYIENNNGSITFK